ncbi:MAG TPA: hypothetical protein VIM65_01270 [Cyclobacteriaceae bacterium]
MKQKTKETRVVIFGTDTDHDVQRSIEKVRKTGREVHSLLRPSFDTGLGICGRHICSCKTECIQ